MSEQASLFEGERSNKAKEIKRLLDDDLNKSKFVSRGDLAQEAIKCFQQLFVEKLNFDPTRGFQDIVEQISTEDWSKGSKAEDAYIIAEAYDFRVLYIELEKLTRTAERNAVRSMRARDWAKEGEYISIFHDGESDVWHLVSPRKGEEESRIVLRRYVIGKGETHRTVSRNLALMDVDRPEPLYNRVQEAFKLQPVTKKFYKDYKDEYHQMYEYLKDEGADLNIQKAKKYTHLTLNRLMFIYFLQKKKWLPHGKNFMNWFVTQYQESSDEGCFHEKWLNTLFFESMNTPEDHPISKDFPEDVKDALESVPFFNGGFEEEDEIDNCEVHFEDEQLIRTIKKFLENYNFTVTEESPFDKEVAVDPAMLGKIYESLIAEEERGKGGIFYTPREEVDLMCRLALYEHLLTKADDPGEKGKKEIIDFLFKPLEEWDEDVKDVGGLMDLLHDVKVVDPACGSGAFLVGMMQVFSELYRKLGKEPDYGFREQIVHENLHGVDIKDWAVRVAEFRMWLALVESEEEVPSEKPVLPNFDFKLKVGDSIVQKVGDKYISLDKITRKAEGSIVNEIEDLKESKREHFEGDSNLEDDIKEKQKDLIKNHLNKIIESLEEKKKKNQVNLKGEITDGAKDKKEELEKEIRRLKKTIEKVDKAEEEELFVWDIDFLEVMFDGGFDVVIANPPYVRQEKIIRQDIDPEQLEEYSSEKVKELKDEYKNDLVSYVKGTYDIKVGKRSDLYVYFFFKGLELLNDEGNLVFISSNSWLDVKFGKYLQEFFCKYVPIKGIYNNKSQRSFEEADVNTVISVLGAPDIQQENFEKKYTVENVWPATTHDAKFITFNKPYVEANKPKNIITLENDDNYYEEIKLDVLEFELNKMEDFRAVKVNQKVLLEDGWEYPKNFDGDPFEKGRYKGNKWGGKFLRAPDVFFDILDKGQNKFSTLQNLSEGVRRGYTSGANKFFYVEDITNQISQSNYEELIGSDQLTWRKFNKSDNLRVIYSLGQKFIIEDDFLEPVIKSPREIKSPILSEDNVSKYLIMCNQKDVSNKFISNYIEAGEDKDYHTGSTCSSRNPWYGLGEREPADLLWMEFINDINRVYVNEASCLESDKFYGITTEKKFPLNSTIISMFRELSGFTSLGQGALKLAVYEVENLLVPNIEVDKKLEDREMNSIFEEVGLSRNEPIREQEPNPLPDRKELDDIVFDALGLSNQEKKEVYWATAELVKARLEKAESV